MISKLYDLTTIKAKYKNLQIDLRILLGQQASSTSVPWGTSSLSLSQNTSGDSGHHLLPGDFVVDLTGGV
jgi:hypothetical protein